MKPTHTQISVERGSFDWVDDLSGCDYGDGCAKTLGSVIKFKLSSSIRIAS
jgi:hypothetical protein